MYIEFVEKCIFNIEKILTELVFIAILLFITFINSEKQIFLLNRISPKFLIANEILEFKSSSKFIKKKEEFINIP